MNDAVYRTKSRLGRADRDFHRTSIGYIRGEHKNFRAEHFQSLYIADLPARRIVFSMLCHPARPFGTFREPCAPGQGEARMCVFGKMVRDGEADSTHTTRNQI